MKKKESVKLFSCLFVELFRGIEIMLMKINIYIYIYVHVYVYVYVYVYVCVCCQIMVFLFVKVKMIMLLEEKRKEKKGGMERGRKLIRIMYDDGMMINDCIYEGRRRMNRK